MHVYPAVELIEANGTYFLVSVHGIVTLQEGANPFKGSGCVSIYPEFAICKAAIVACFKGPLTRPN